MLLLCRAKRFDDNLLIVLDFKKKNSNSNLDGNNIDGYVIGKQRFVQLMFLFFEAQTQHKQSMLCVYFFEN